MFLKEIMQDDHMKHKYKLISNYDCAKMHEAYPSLQAEIRKNPCSLEPGVTFEAKSNCRARHRDYR